MTKTYEYENVQIGVFLVSLGYYLKEFGYTEPMCVSLNQQTPNDSTLGDLFSKINSKYFFVEFKSSKKNLATEFNKKQRIRLKKKLLNTHKRLIPISKKCHFISFPEFKSKKIEFKLLPYFHNSSYKCFNIKQFIYNILNIKKTHEIGVNFTEITSYIKLLKLCITEEDKKNYSGASSGILMIFDNKNKKIQYHIYESLNSLNMKKEKKVKKSKGIS